MVTNQRHQLKEKQRLWATASTAWAKQLPFPAHVPESSSCCPCIISKQHWWYSDQDSTRGLITSGGLSIQKLASAPPCMPLFCPDLQFPGAKPCSQGAADGRRDHVNKIKAKPHSLPGWHSQECRCCGVSRKAGLQGH